MNKVINSYLNRRRNRSSLYLFPLIYDEFNVTPANVTKKDNGFKMLNLFIGDDEKPEYHNCLFMLIKIYDYENPNFKLFIAGLKNNGFFQECYSVGTHLIMLVFNIREEDKCILRDFIRGKYSNFPESYKEYFPKDFTQSIKSQYNVLTRNNLLKHKIEQDLNISLSDDAELDDKPYLEEEIFRYDR